MSDASIIRRLAHVTRLPSLWARAIVRNRAALRVFDDTGCAALGPPFVASDTRLVGPGDDEGWRLVYSCACEACLEAEERLEATEAARAS